MLIVRLLVRLWRALKKLYVVLLPLRFKFLALGVLLFAFRYSDQGLDILSALTERATGASHWPMVWFIAFSNLLAYQLWYWSRHLLRYRPHADEGGPSLNDFPRWTKWMPRVIGLAVFVIEISGFMQVEHRVTVIGLLAVFALVYWLVVVYRRDFIDLTPATDRVRSVDKFDDPTRWLYIFAIVADVGLFAWAWTLPVSWHILGVAATLVLTFAVWSPIGTGLTLLGEKLRFPIFGALLVWAIVISPHTDNHELRKRAALPPRLSFPEALNRQTGKPLIIVATEGGGIRAAYWTATALVELTRKFPEFPEHCFAISGVSGGSVGAVVYDAILARHIPPNDPRPVHEILASNPPTQSEVRAMLGFDALSGTLAAMAQPDLTQRFVPIPYFPDRQTALEKGWECGSKQALDQAFVETMNRNPRLPNLFLNGTVVESGGRIIASNVRLRSEIEFRNAFDVFDELQYDIRLSTAAGMSARFTYVSPAGKIPFTRRCTGPDCGRELFGHVVDGGYFENSGAVTAMEIAAAAKRLHPDVPIYVVLIDYGEDGAAHCPFCPAPDLSGPTPPVRAEDRVNEVMSPLRAVLNARTARGVQAVGDAITGNPDNFAELRLVQSDVRLPLGWVLSDAAMTYITNAANVPQNRLSFDNVSVWLRGGTRQPACCGEAQCNDAKSH